MYPDLRQWADRLPSELRYDAGDPRLPGYQIVEHKRYARVAVGGSLLGVGYALTIAFTFAVSGGTADYLTNNFEPFLPRPEYSLMPVAGPIIEGIWAISTGRFGAYAAFPYLLLAGMQWVGAGLLIAGPSTTATQVRTGCDGRTTPVVQLTASGLELRF